MYHADHPSWPAQGQDLSTGNLTAPAVFALANQEVRLLTLCAPALQHPENTISVLRWGVGTASVLPSVLLVLLYSQ